MFDGETLSINLNTATAKIIEPNTDAELVQAILAGDDAAFNVIFERYSRLVVHLIARFFNSREMVEDLSQQAFTKIYFSLKDFRGENDKSFSSWLSRLTVNTCYDELRKRQRRPENLFAELSSDDVDFVDGITETGQLDNESDFVNKDLAERLLSGLEAEDRMAITLYHGEDHSISEVAEILGWSASKVKTRLMRTRQYLRKLFDRLD
jgi:RNA polymerase sigma-70 factor (ECF subfamily)